MTEAFRVALIGGTSHVGKSTTALALAARLGWACELTDRIGRHPGRPWPTATFTPPDHVARHYRTLTPEELTAAQLAHYRGMAPLIRERITTHAAKGGEPLVLEGSGVLPWPVAGLGLPDVRAVWLTAAPALIAARVRRESGFEGREPDTQADIARFIRRSQLYDAEVIGQVRRLDLSLVEVTAEMDANDVADACLARLRG